MAATRVAEEYELFWSKKNMNPDLVLEINMMKR